MFERRDSTDTITEFYVKGADELNTNSMNRSLSNSATGGPFFIGVCGGTASGKTTVCEMIVQELRGSQRVSVISLDSFYRPLTRDEMALAEHSNFNFDHPDAFDFEALVAIIKKMQKTKTGEIVEVPIYDFVTHSRSKQTRKVNLGDVVVVEGILVFSHADLRSLFHMKVFVDTDDDLRLARRISRDIVERGRTVESVLEQYARFVKPSFDEFIMPTKKFADVIIPFSRQNKVGIDVIVKHIQSKLSTPDLSKVFTNLYIMPNSAQIRMLQTLVHDRTTARDDFIFYSDRLLRLLVEEALGHLPFEEKTVQTPQGSSYVGICSLPSSSITAVSIVRGGESMETAIRAVLKDIAIGKILIETEFDKAGKKKSKLTYCKLPPDVANRWVMLMDPVIYSGQSVMLALERLKQASVVPSKVLVVALSATPFGVRNICSKFPDVKMIISELNQTEGADVDRDDFADIYFGTSADTHLHS